MRNLTPWKLMTVVMGLTAVGQAAAQAGGQQAQNAAAQAQIAAQQVQASQRQEQATRQAQPTGPQAPPPSQDASTAVLKVDTQLVIVDVVVQNKDGKPVHGLKPETFQLTEDGVPQKIRHFEEHSTLQPPPKGPELPKLPAGMYTDYAPASSNETLNILLMDSLNTPANAQSYVHNQLEDYIKHAKPGTRIAIFGLANQLVLLQGFTADPETLKEAVHHKLITRYSSLLDDPGGNGNDPITAAQNAAPEADLTTTPTNAGVAATAANLQQFEAETQAIQVQMRVQYTLDALNALGHYLAAFPGRKNLIWFSGSFPLSILPDPSLVNPFGIANINQDEFRDTTNLLAKAQVAVYPVDARGLATPTVYNAGSSGRRYGANPQGFSRDVSRFTSSQNAEHSTMDDLAGSTGGRAFYNTNGLSDAVSEAIDAGSNYYTLVYTPTVRKEDGGYRKIKVESTDNAVKGGVQLSYRQGYYTKDASRKDATTSATVAGTAGGTTASTGGPAATAAAFQRTAMSRGAPTPQEMLFTVRVLPASAATESTVAFGNQLAAKVSAKGPFRRYDIDYVALPKEVTLALQPDGRRVGKMDFLVYVFDVEGTLLNTYGTSATFNLGPKDYKSFMQNAIQAHVEVSAPARGESFLRIGVRDAATNRFGVVEVPTASVKQLAPPVYQSAPAAAPAAPAATPNAAATPDAAAPAK